MLFWQKRYSFHTYTFHRKWYPLHIYLQLPVHWEGLLLLLIFHLNNSLKCLHERTGGWVCLGYFERPFKIPKFSLERGIDGCDRKRGGEPPFPYGGLKWEIIWNLETWKGNFQHPGNKKHAVDAVFLLTTLTTFN